MGRPRKKDKHLPPCVYPKHNAYYYVKRNVWVWLGDTLASAMKTYAERFEAPAHGLDNLVDRTLANCSKTIAASTLVQYTSIAGRLKKLLREFSSPKQVTAGDIVEIRDGMRHKASMANQFLSFARQVFDLAIEDKAIPSNPVFGVKRVKEKERERLLMPNELARIYAESDAELQVIEDLMYLTGQRVVATLTIKVADLLEDGIRFPQFKTPTKRIVKWTPEIRAVVERAKALRGNVRSMVYLLPGHGGSPPNYRTVARRFKAACVRAGVEDAQMRDYRAVSATEAEAQGMDPTALLGHTSRARTRRYLRAKSEPVVSGPNFRRLIDASEKK